MLQPGDTIAGYRILGKCGHGAFGQVYLVEDGLGRRLAVKQLLTAENGEYELKGIRNYIRVGISAPSLLPILHFGIDQGLPFYVMEAADNALDNGYEPDTLSRRLQQQGRLPANEALAICHSLLDGLEALHNAGLVHRDVKPENVLFVHGEPKLADPGLTRNFTQTLSIAGTPGYLAPETFRGHISAAATLDIYALGKLLYHLVTGNSPELFPELPRDLPVDILYQVCHPLTRLCAESPEARPQTCAECRAILPQAIEHHGPVLRVRDALFVRPVLRRRLALLVAACLFLILAASLTAVGVSRYRTHRLSQLAAQREAVTNDLNALERRFPALRLQLADLDEPALAAALAADDPWQLHALAAADDRQLDKLAATLDSVRSELRAVAERHLPDINSEPLDFQSCADGWSYLSSPLGRYFLPEAAQSSLRVRLQEESKRLAGSRGFPLGETAKPLYGLVHLPFVAPGSFISPANGSVQHLDHPFWIFDKEITCEQFTGYTDLQTRRNSSWQAAEYLCWNEALVFCRNLTENIRHDNFLPAGYAFRPPTEAEWEFAALGGWENETPPTRIIPPDSTNRAPGDSPPNALGLRGLDDNLSEIAIPYPNSTLLQPDAVVVRGANYHSSKTTDIKFRADYVLSQAFYRGGGGLRPVLAPVDDKFFERAWYRGPEIGHVLHNGRVYAGWSTCTASTTWKAAADLASALGASLPESTDLQELTEIRSSLSIITAFSCPLGIHRVDGTWQKLSAPGQPINLPIEIPSEYDALGATRALQPAMTEGIFVSVLLQWPSQQAFDDRLDSWLRHSTIMEFEIDGQRFAVCKVILPAIMVRQFVKFLGARQPIFKSSEHMQSIVEKVPPGLYIALGPIHFYNSWEQFDGSTSSFPGLAIDTSQLRNMFPQIFSVLGANHGKPTALDFIDSILIDMGKVKTP